MTKLNTFIILHHQEKPRSSLGIDLCQNIKWIVLLEGRFQIARAFNTFPYGRSTNLVISEHPPVFADFSGKAHWWLQREKNKKHDIFRVFRVHHNKLPNFWLNTRIKNHMLKMDLKTYSIKNLTKLLLKNDEKECFISGLIFT